MSRAEHDATGELPDAMLAPDPEFLEQLLRPKPTAAQRQQLLDAKRRHVEKHLGRPLRRGEEDRIAIRARDGAVVTRDGRYVRRSLSNRTGATTRAARGPAPGRRQGSRRTTARVAARGAARGDRDGPEPEPPGRRRGDLIHVGVLLPSLLDRLEQGILEDDDAADLSWWLAGRRP